MKLIMILQIICALGLLNVWLLRNQKSSLYRGGNSKNLKEEFKAYGLPDWVYYVVGFLKVGSAILFLIGIWLPVVVLPAACLVAFLMLGALSMHFKVHDPILKSLPAALMLLLSLGIILGRVYFKV